MAGLDLVPPVDIKGQRGWGEARGSVISSGEDLDPAKSPLAGFFVSLIPLHPEGREAAQSSLTGDRRGLEKSWWEPSITIAVSWVSTSFAIPHREWLLMYLEGLGPPQDPGHLYGAPKGGGEEQGGDQQ